MLFLLGGINWKPACAVWAWNAVGEPGALFCRVECSDARGTLVGGCLLCAWDEPCSCSISWRFLVEELILYVELTVETWSCWIACGNTVVLVEWMDSVWKHCTQR